LALKVIGGLLRDAAVDWYDDNVPRLAAAMAFYTLLSLAPLLVISVSVAGAVFGDEAARGEIVGQLRGLLGREAAEAIQSVLASARETHTNVVGAVIGGIALFFGASGTFAELQSALDTVWEVKPKEGRGVRGVIRDRFVSFAAVLGVGFLLLVSLVISAVLSAAGAYFTAVLPGGAALWQSVNVVVSIAMITVLFALIFKLVPDVQIGWRDVWIGALVTSLLFVLGKLAIGFYLGRSGVASPYGAAGSVVVVVVWVYYSAQILFFGAEFTQVYARRYGSHIPPSPNAVSTATPAV
jgi:membrane protein